MTSGKLLTVFFLGLLLTEMGLRFGVGLGQPPLVERHPDTEYQLIANRSYMRFGNEITINSYALRGEPIPDSKAANQRRVMLIGDSVVYGNHFLDQDATISAQLLNDLKRSNRLSECQVFVMPVAVSSWGPVNQAAFLQNSGVLGADVAVLLISGHDLHDTPHFGQILPYRTSQPFGAIHDALIILAERWAKPEPHPQHFLERANSTLAALDRMADQFSVAGIPFVTVYHPTTVERASHPMTERDRFDAWASTRDVPFRDLRETDLTAEDYRDAIHPTATGARTIARTLASEIAPYLSDCG